jgi:hypothetical protein
MDSSRRFSYGDITGTILKESSKSHLPPLSLEFSTNVDKVDNIVAADHADDLASVYYGHLVNIILG